MEPKLKFYVGDVVQAKVAIVDADMEGVPYIHALPGTYGLVIGDPGDGPCVAWVTGNEPGGGGVCNVDHTDIKRVPSVNVVQYPGMRPYQRRGK